MKEHYVSYEQAVKLQELGFDWECARYYTNDYVNDDPEDVTREVKLHLNYPYNHNMFAGRWTAPRLDQAQAWLRDTKELHVLPKLENVNKPDYVCIITHLRKECKRITDNGKYFPTYEAALSAGITEALKILEEIQSP